MKISVGSDHAGKVIKDLIIEHLQQLNIEVSDEGTYSLASCDYPDFAKKVCQKVVNKEADFGILVCYTGIGMSMAANHIKGIRAALVSNIENARLTREHNDANVLCLGAKDSEPAAFIDYVDTFINTPFSKEERHQRRIDKIEN